MIAWTQTEVLKSWGAGRFGVFLLSIQFQDLRTWEASRPRGNWDEDCLIGTLAVFQAHCLSELVARRLQSVLWGGSIEEPIVIERPFLAWGLAPKQGLGRRCLVTVVWVNLKEGSRGIILSSLLRQC